ncbi:MAG TPA: hypothetical protein VJ901_08945, partial [Thermoanaerobaculia bacterium]|nr:hypothetical protein [Thermoanaerobaculia bacterium]
GADDLIPFDPAANPDPLRSVDQSLRGTIRCVAVGDDTFAYRRDLPHLQKNGKTYFVTFCAIRVLSESERDIVLQCCVHDHRETYFLHCVVVMPDHVHMILTPFEGWTFGTIMHRVKSVSAHCIGGRIWQREYFDHILRSSERLSAKAEYVCMNPVRAGLVTEVGEYRWLWREWGEGGIAAGSAAPHKKRG